LLRESGHSTILRRARLVLLSLNFSFKKIIYIQKSMWCIDTMQLIMIIIWLIIFLIFLVINISEKSKIFGAFAGLWSMLLGLLIIVDGVHIEGGISITESGGVQELTYNYVSATLPYSGYAFIWGMFFIGISIYILYANLLKE